MSTQPIPRYTIEQYLDTEDLAEHRHEYLDGRIFERAAVSVSHSRLVGNVYAGLRPQLSGESRCEAFVGSFGLCIGAKNSVTYPDLFVVCGPLSYYENRRDSVTEASVIVEVLSPSTADYDRGGKFRLYRSVPSFREYLLISQDAVRFEHYVRQPDGSWVFREYASLEDQIDIPSIGCHLSLSAVYDRIEF